MENNSGNMSIDFLIAFTIFMLAFIWVATMIPNLFLGLTAHGIDTDAVAYRTAVILAEDPGATTNKGTLWEQEIAAGKGNINRFGLAVSKDTPNILSPKKVERFFSTDFTYPDDYRERVIFGDYAYRFNISLLGEGESLSQARHVGEPLPESNYGFIRREVKIKGYSNATIDKTDYNEYELVNKDTRPAGTSGAGDPGILDGNVTIHRFVIQINRTQLLTGNITNPPLNPSQNAAYQIDPRQDRIIINVTDTAVAPAVPAWVTLGGKTVTTLQLNDVRFSTSTTDADAPYDLTGYDMDFLYIDSPDHNAGTLVTTFPQDVNGKDICLFLKPGFFGPDSTDNRGSAYITLTFKVVVNCGGASPCWSPQGPTANGKMQYLNTSKSGPWTYTYNSTEVTQPKLTNAVLEVAVW
jgi:hypothetical protein